MRDFLVSLAILGLGYIAGFTSCALLLVPRFMRRLKQVRAETRYYGGDEDGNWRN